MNKLLAMNREDVIKIFVKACGITPASEKKHLEEVKHELNGVDDKTLIEKRKKHLVPTYRHFYNNPLHLVRGIIIITLDISFVHSISFSFFEKKLIWLADLN